MSCQLSVTSQLDNSIRIAESERLYFNIPLPQTINLTTTMPPLDANSIESPTNLYREPHQNIIS
jgi:hypothetical protein